MEKGHSADQRFLATGLLVSVALHAFAGWMLVEDVDPFKTPPGPEAVEVELVPPPEVVVPEPPEQAEEPEEEEPEERPEAAETEPEEEPVEPESEQEPEEEQVASLPQLEEQEIRVLQPVVEFGEEDSGPSDSEDGAPQQAEDETETDEPEEEPEPETVSEEPEEADEPLTAEEEPAEEPVDEPEIVEPTDETEPSEESPAEQQTAEDQPQEIPSETPEVIAGETPLEPELVEPEPEPVVPEPAEEAAGEETGPEDFGTVGKIVTSATPVAKPKRTTAERSGSSRRMVQARQFFSDDLASNPRVRTAMAGMGQSERLNLLCMTELRGQLTAANPPMFADLMPSFRPPPGTVLEPRNAAVRSFGQWFDIDFRCEVDHSVTRVVSFEYRIGPEIPRSQWKQRGFPG